MKRKLMLACCVWHEDYIRGLMRGISRRIEEEDLELHVFISHDTANDASLQRKEQEIFSLPDLEDYNGILIASTSEGNKEVMDKLIEEGLRHNKKMLSIEKKFENIPSAGVDNYREFYRMVEHMITVHDCKVFNYIGGPETNEENQQRYRAFCDCLANHNLEVQEERVGHFRFMSYDGKTAYDRWKEKGLHLPDAVVSANDTMAMGYCNAAMADGYHIPEDFRISGFDNFAEGQLFCVSLTSVNRHWEQLGYDSVDRLLEFVEGTKEPEDFYSQGKLVLNESCGCASDRRDVRADISYVYHEKKQKTALELGQRTSRLVLCRCRNLSDLQKQLKWCPDGSDIKNLAFCLNRSLFEEDMTGDKTGYDSEIHVVTRDREIKMTKKETMNPADYCLEEKSKIYLFSSLNFGGDTYGYCVASYDDRCLLQDRYRTFKEIASVALESIKQKEELNRMNLKLQQLYVQDPMTGLYNRFGYMNQAEQYLQEHHGEIFLIYIDVDNLKTINDSFGHGMGDMAIQGVAEALKSVFGKDSVCVRMGGDEFLVMEGSKEEQAVLEKEEAVLAYLKEYSIKNDFPFILHASMGHISSSGNRESLEVLVKQADHKMYEIKQKRKKGIL